ncbi:MAG TPA: TlpA disulfide reductase family protein [Panacibacter sp.]|nr:TlpA disulfide reductase family protein [Panacibacter sp.]HNP43895.1 TlpA disulfide reductase family protein [Panacibacter sp.]
MNVTIKGAAGKKIYLVRLPFLDEKEAVLDSATVVDVNHPVEFLVEDKEQRPYVIRVKESGKIYQFINDTKEVRLDINHINGKYSIALSPASESLKRFNDSQAVLADSLRQLAPQMKKPGDTAAGVKVLYDRKYEAFRKNYFHYADTVRSAAAFLSVLDNVDFGNSYEDQKAFINKAATRFADYLPIQQMRTEILNMVKIYEEEYNVGDQIPAVKLPDSNGEDFSTASMQGRYYLLDIWASWCPQCRVYNYYKKQLLKQVDSRQFAIVSIAMDDETEPWKSMIDRDSLGWRQLIDAKLWRGTAANTLKFDSIPFNFLIDPNGKIVAKAIKADSLFSVVSAFVKR